MEAYFGELALVRWLVQRGLAGIYLVAFVSALNQFRPLLGERGFLPVRDFLARVPFTRAPSVFYAHYSDRFFAVVAWTGIVLSIVAMLGVSDAHGELASIVVWLTLYVLYLSIVNVGQTFYAFGWESMLLEAGFFAIFLGPTREVTPLVTVLALRFMLFRVELGAGLIKLRHDSCWRDLTCLYFHHETQPLPNPMSALAHRLPKLALRGGVAFSHLVQVVAPFGLFFPQPVSSISGALIIGHQLLLIVFGNYAWLNWLTVVLGLTAMDDRSLGLVVPHSFVAMLENASAPQSQAFEVAVVLVGLATIAMGTIPVKDLFSKHQKMNATYNPLHLVSSYGAFGSVTKTRYEIVVEGTDALDLGPGTVWREYGFRGKPGEPHRRPPQVAPYHLRLDWLMWFLPFSVIVMGERVFVSRRERWFMRFVERLLEADAPTRALLRIDPFGDTPPTFVRARFVKYTFANAEQRRTNGVVWMREPKGMYLSPISLEDVASH